MEYHHAVMSRPLLWIAVAIAALLVARAVVPLFRSASPSASGPAGLAGRVAPVFELQDDRGTAVSLRDYRGKVVILNLWASWCPPCRAEMPDLQRLQRAYASRGLVVVGINQGESPDRARAFAQSLGIAFPIWIDDQQQYGRVLTAQGLPTTVVVGRDGRVIHGYDGPLTFNQMQTVVSSLMPAS